MRNIRKGDEPNSLAEYRSTPNATYDNFRDKETLRSLLVNGDGCTEMLDFMFLLDNWEQEVDGVEVNLVDFLNLLDNWQAGPNC